MEQFLASQREVVTFLRKFAAIDLAGVVFPNPLIGGIRFSLATGLHVLAAHERRHLWQAWQVRRAAEQSDGVSPVLETPWARLRWTRRVPTASADQSGGLYSPNAARESISARTTHSRDLASWFHSLSPRNKERSMLQSSAPSLAMIAALLVALSSLARPTTPWKADVMCSPTPSSSSPRPRNQAGPSALTD